MPTLSNTGSYLKDLYVDWGIVGTMFIVYLLAITCSLVFESYRRKKSIVLLAVLCHLYVLVFFTFALQATVWTYWLISLAGSVLGAVIIENSGRGKDEKTMWTIA